jgi:hypothetical protein
VSGGYDRTVRLSTLDGTPVWVRALATTVYSVTIGEGVVVVGGLDDSVRVLTLANGRERVATGPVEGPVTSVAVGEWRGLPVVAAVCNGTVFCWTRVRAAPVPVIPPPWPVLAVTVTAAGELVAVGVRGVTVVEPSPGAPA